MLRKIQIGKHTYKVLYKNFGGLLDNYGTTLVDKNEIHVDTTVAQSRQEVTLAHEILHALFEESGVNERLKDDEELIVRMLENKFYEFLKDNTDFYD